MEDIKLKEFKKLISNRKKELKYITPKKNTSKKLMDKFDLISYQK